MNGGGCHTANVTVTTQESCVTVSTDVLHTVFYEHLAINYKEHKSRYINIIQHLLAIV